MLYMINIDIYQIKSVMSFITYIHYNFTVIGSRINQDNSLLIDCITYYLLMMLANVCFF